MLIKALNKVVDNVANATVEMKSGDHLSIAFKDIAGWYQTVYVQVQGSVAVVTHEQTQDAMVIRRNESIFIEDGAKNFPRSSKQD